MHGTPKQRPDPKARTRPEHQYKMLASTMQFPNNNPVAPPTRANPLPQGKGAERARAVRGKPKQRPRRTPSRRSFVSCCLRTQQCAKDPNGAFRPDLSNPQAGVLDPEKNNPPGHDSLTFHP